MKFLHIFFLMLAIIGCIEESSLGFVEAKKKGKKGKKVKKAKKAGIEIEEMPDISSPKRPLEIEPRVYCFACQVMIDYAIKVLDKKTSEADVLTVVDQNNI